ncbi:hypothetical protein L1987_13318 [Smallanthus sonchifolius]|uniref:Uncharacterized protein n=1 Tax=Smallanthus sonchifolius TaxID=185202 RepID=A0ACB9JGL7_9ASTR|nr:hypothetical protein L1987_13318 [Smallanthus sonchifolius]
MNLNFKTLIPVSLPVFSLALSPFRFLPPSPRTGATSRNFYTDRRKMSDAVVQARRRCYAEMQWSGKVGRCGGQAWR